MNTKHCLIKILDLGFNQDRQEWFASAVMKSFNGRGILLVLFMKRDKVGNRSAVQ